MSEKVSPKNFWYDFPNYVNYGQGDKKNNIMKNMNDLIYEPWSPFNSHTMQEVFLFCASYAYARKLDPKKPPSASNGMPGTRFRNDGIINLMKAIAIDSTQKIETAINAKEVVKICESYAYPGFLHIFDEIVKLNKDGKSSIEILEILIRDCQKNKKDLNE